MERHLFVALQLPKQVKLKLAETCKKIEKEHSFKTWVHPEDYHVTLAFLGKADRDQLYKLIPLLCETVEEHQAFSLNIDHFGFFGSKEHPRIFWAGMKEEARLYNLQKQVAYACKQADFTLEKRSYSPHITLARKFIESLHLPVDSNEWWQVFGEEIHFQAEHIVIYETHFEKQPKYQIVQSCSLNR